MATIKKNLTNTNSYLDDPNLSLSEKGLLSVLINSKDEFNPSMESIVESNTNGIKSIRSVFNSLINKNYLKRIKTRDKHGYFRYDYEVYDCKYKNKTYELER